MKYVTKASLIATAFATVISCSQKNETADLDSSENSSPNTSTSTSSNLPSKSGTHSSNLSPAPSAGKKPSYPGISKIENYDKIAPSIRAVEKLYSQTDSLQSIVPKQMAAGQNGYLIATNEDFKKNSKVLADFIKHKESLGFKVYVATEKDWGVSEKGSGKGRHQADVVRKWMQENYKKLNLLYTLIIDNPHPDEGQIPMAKFKPRRYKVPTPEQKRDYAKYLKYKDNPRTEDGKFLLYDGSDPSDYYYADLDSEWDANGNTILADKADYATGKINCIADVYVGRIPLYGGDHPYSQVADADDILRRTIDFETAKGDLSWRNNMFYVGGADRRFKKMQDHFFQYTGGSLETYRVSSGYGYEPTAQKWNNGVISNALNQNKKFGFINFQEHGSWNSMAGQINSASAEKLRTDFPGYVYLGGCDVASPEHGTNVTYTLFRRLGIAGMGATRSVTSLGGDDDTDSAACYERLYFGQSTGEAHWRLLSDYADGKGKVGASNFLMNLMGDPSVVVMPKITISPVVVSPNMETLKFNHQHRSKNPLGYDFTVRNATDKARNYQISSKGLLTFSADKFELAPFETKTIKVSFNTAHLEGVGLHNTSFTVHSGEYADTRNLALNIYARTTVLSHSYNTLNDRRILGYDVKGEKAEMVKKMIAENAKDTFVTMPAGTRADLSRTKVVPGESNVTITAKFKFDKKPKGKLQFFKLGKTFECFDLSIEGGKLYCIFRTVQGKAEAPTEGRIELPTPKMGEWHTFVASVNRSEKKMTFILNGEEHTTGFNPQPGQGLVFDKIRFGYGKNKQTIYLDEYSIFDYCLEPHEVAAIGKGQIVKQEFPKNNDLANPAGINLSWNSSVAPDTTYVVSVSNNPNFLNAKEYETKDTTKVITDLSDKTTYFWKVGFKENGKSVYPWDSFTTFTTDSTLENPEITINARKLRAHTSGDSSYTAHLGKIASAFTKPNDKGKRKKIELFFAKVEGAEWLRCHSDGSLTTNHGAPAPGKYKFVFSVSSRYGLPVTFERTIIAK